VNQKTTSAKLCSLLAYKEAIKAIAMADMYPGVIDGWHLFIMVFLQVCTSLIERKFPGTLMDFWRF